MTQIPQVTDETIKRRFGERNLKRGYEYLFGGAIRHPRRHGNMLKAECKGSHRQPYSVRIMFGQDDRGVAVCTCPVGDRGQCKHVAAVLLAWREQPHLFTEIDDIDTLLECKSRRELMSLVKEMIRRSPELEMLIETNSLRH